MARLRKLVFSLLFLSFFSLNLVPLISYIKNDQLIYNTQTILSINDFSNFTLLDNSLLITSQNDNNSITFTYSESNSQIVDIENYYYQLLYGGKNFNITLNLNCFYNKGLLGDLYLNLTNICYLSVSNLLSYTGGYAKITLYQNITRDPIKISNKIESSISDFIFKVSRKDNYTTCTISMNNSTIINQLSCDDNLYDLFHIVIGCKIYPYFNDEITLVFSSISAEIELSNNTYTPPITTPTQSPSSPTTNTTYLSFFELLANEPKILIGGIIGLTFFTLFISSFVIFSKKRK